MGKFGLGLYGVDIDVIVNGILKMEVTTAHHPIPWGASEKRNASPPTNETPPQPSLHLFQVCECL